MYASIERILETWEDEQVHNQNKAFVNTKDLILEIDLLATLVIKIQDGKNDLQAPIEIYKEEIQDGIVDPNDQNSYLT